MNLWGNRDIKRRITVLEKEMEALTRDGPSFARGFEAQDDASYEITLISELTLWDERVRLKVIAKVYGDARVEFIRGELFDA